ncbi:MAG: hypothetical protein GTO55_11300 [Armatimonadetes bacterium]|nr:hypothetical protein [Armatimonadota bacterium]NIM24802.1 hypothetical protein [Armatimonadota bacterium]NIM68693.1 hypothetical protein [Armatimonadota bacterium]NIM76988.1 hypothetical protein [Armatimonadota bacterium]NIN06894.1 hypothetical protein [Armatimonadota bacterium]
MGYSTPGECRMRTVGMNTLVIPDVSSTSLNLTVCIAEADSLIDEAGRQGDYAVPFSPVPERIRDLSAMGAIARARRALDLGNQEALSETFDGYQREFEGGLRLLREGALDLGTSTVSAEAVVMSVDYSTWTGLAHAGLAQASVTLTSSGGVTTYTEDRGEYDHDYLPAAVKDYQVDHLRGRVRRLSGGRIGSGEQVEISYEYYYRQPADPQDAEYGGKGAAVGEMRRGDS